MKKKRISVENLQYLFSLNHFQRTQREMRKIIKKIHIGLRFVCFDTSVVYSKYLHIEVNVYCKKKKNLVYIDSVPVNKRKRNNHKHVMIRSI